MNVNKLADAKKKLLEINKTIKQLDPAIRGAAFEFIAPMLFDNVAATEGESKTKREPATKPETVADTGDKEEFFKRFESNKAKDNVALIVAWLYSQYGKFPITRADIDSEAAITGLTVSDRPDNTMRSAKHGGKNLFRKKGKGWELTVSGESRTKEVYKVKKGSKSRPTEDD